MKFRRQVSIDASSLCSPGASRWQRKFRTSSASEAISAGACRACRVMLIGILAAFCIELLSASARTMEH